MNQDRHVSFASLFSGCGGFDLGFIQAGYRPIGAYDLDVVAVNHFRTNVNGDAHVADLTQSISGIKRLRPAIVIAGPPCQGFSTVGSRDVDDRRNHLLPLAGIIATGLRPKVVVVENVAAAQSGEHRRYWDELDAGLRDAGYRTSTQKWNAVDVGLPQSRRRLLLFAWKGSRDPLFACPVKPPRRLADVLAGVEGLSGHAPQMLDPSSKLYQIALRIGPGQKLSNVRGGSRSVHTWHIPEVFGRTTARECQMLEFIMRVRRAERRRLTGDADPVRMNRLIEQFGAGAVVTINSLLKKQYLRHKEDGLDLCHSFNGKCRRFRWDDIACAVDTRFGDPHLFLHPNEHRPFTVREAARIQGLPDTYSFVGKDKDAFRLIGNAVPPAMARQAAEILAPIFSR